MLIYLDFKGNKKALNISKREVNDEIYVFKKSFWLWVKSVLYKVEENGEMSLATRVGTFF